MQRRNAFSRILLVFTLFTLLCAGVFVPRVGEAKPVNANALDVVINEVAWSGTQANANAEWIELYNPTSSDINLTGWTLIAQDGTPSISLSGTILAGGYYLLERTADTTVANVTADLIYTGALSNTVEVLVLRDNLSNTIDTANMGGATWYAGSVAGFYSMERINVVSDSSTAWASNNGTTINGLDNGGNPIHGTPKQPNSVNPPTLTPTTTNTFTVTNTPTETFTPSQTFTPSETFTSTQTFTATRTNTPTSTVTSTATATFTPSNTFTPTSALPMTVIFSEIAWAGTAASSSDEWIELYNPGAFPINLAGWRIQSADGNPSITITNGIIPAGGYFLLERGDDNTVSNILADFIYNTGNITMSNSGESLTLYDISNAIIDTANLNGGTWPAGSSSTYGTMERIGLLPDSDSAWNTNIGLSINGEDANGDPILGTPKNGNSPTPTPTITPTISLTPTITRTTTATRTKTPTRTKTLTRTPTVTRTPTRIPPVGRPVINEFLPRPGFDWNQDGNVDVFDEFIEIKNLGPVDINLSGWKLDDAENSGSNPYTLPNINLKPGERAVFYGSETNILLSDGGDAVRLLNSGNKVYDSYTYPIVKVEDKSWCRFPDGRDWYDDCVPTPNETNTREGKSPTMPDGESFESPVCNLPDTLPEAFFIAECKGFGANIWRMMYWDANGWGGDILVPAHTNKWESYIE